MEKSSVFLCLKKYTFWEVSKTGNFISQNPCINTFGIYQKKCKDFETIKIILLKYGCVSTCLIRTE